jgi:hypothetical protein
MDILKTTTGLTCLVLTEDETKKLKSLLNNDLPTLIKGEDPFKYLHLRTIEFLKELKNKYGSQRINGSDPFLISLKRKYYITDLSSMLKKLNKNGHCELVMNIDRKVNSIDYFILKL